MLWSPLALDRTSEIAEYMARHNPAAAADWINAIFARVDQLGGFPESGRIVPEINSLNIRELMYSNYRIIYRLEEKRLSVLAMRHVKQILPTDEMGA